MDANSFGKNTLAAADEIASIFHMCTEAESTGAGTLGDLGAIKASLSLALGHLDATHLLSARSARNYGSRYLTRKEAADYVGISIRVMDERKSDGAFPDYVQSTWHTKAQLDDYIMQLEAFGKFDKSLHRKAMTQRREAFCAGQLVPY